MRPPALVTRGKQLRSLSSEEGLRVISEKGLHVTLKPLPQRGKQLGYTWTGSSHLVSDNSVVELTDGTMSSKIPSPRGLQNKMERPQFSAQTPRQAGRKRLWASGPWEVGGTAAASPALCGHHARHLSALKGLVITLHFLSPNTS